MAQEMVDYQRETITPAEQAEAKANTALYNELLKKEQEGTLTADETAKKSTLQKNPLLRAQELADRAGNGSLSHTQFEKIKSDYERTHTLKYDAAKPAAEKQRQLNLDSAIREAQQQYATDAGFANIKDINKGIQKYHAITDLLEKHMGDPRINELGLADYMLMAEAFVKPDAILALVGKKIFQS